MNRLFVAHVFASVCLAPSLAFSAPSGADFLLLEPTARAAAIAGAYSAQGGRPEALRYNPAGLAGIPRLSASIAHVTAPGDWTHEWAGLGTRLGALALGAEILVSSIKPFELYNVNGDIVDIAQAGSQNLLLAAALNAPGRWLALGVGFRAFRSQLYKFSSQGLAADFGAQAHPRGWPLSFGLALQNLGTESAYVVDADDLPTCGRAGVSAKLPLEQGLDVEPSLDLLAFLDPSRPVELRIGLQADVYERLGLRAGILRTGNAMQLSFGLGVNWDGWGLDYAFLPGSELGSTHMLELHLASSR